MYVCPHDVTVNEDVLSIFTILSHQPSLKAIPAVEQETGMDEERVRKVKTHLACCEKCAEVLEEYSQMQRVLEQARPEIMSQFHPGHAAA